MRLIKAIFILLFIPSIAAATILSQEDFEGPCDLTWYQYSNGYDNVITNFVGPDGLSSASGYIDTGCSNGPAYTGPKYTSIYKDTSTKHGGSAALRLYDPDEVTNFNSNSNGLGETSEIATQEFSATDVWVSYWERLSQEPESNETYYIDAGHKWLLFKMSPDASCNSSDCYISVNSYGGGETSHTGRVYGEIKVPPQSKNLFGRLNVVPLPRGQWYKVKVHIKLNSFTGSTPNADGQFHMWYDFGSGWQEKTSLDSYVDASDLDSLILRTNSSVVIRAVRFGGTRSTPSCYPATCPPYKSRGNKWLDDIIIATTEAEVDSGASSTVIDITANDNEADENGYQGQVTVSCSGTCPGTASVAITRSGTATYGAGIDYTDNLSSPITSFPTVITLTPYDDSTSEATETAIYTGSCTNCSFSSSSATISIFDNDVTTQTVTVAATDSSGSETGPDNAEFTISRGVQITGDLVVNYTMSGTATNGVDYQTLSGTATILNGNTSVAISVAVIDDYNGSEDDAETVVLTIADGSYTIGTPSNATATIQDNDVYPFGSGDIWGEHPESDHTGVVTDTYLSGGSSNANYSGTGGLKIYTWPVGTSINTSLIRIDLTALSNSETATLYLNNTGREGTNTETYYVSAHQVTGVTPIIENATWNCASDTNFDGTCDVAWASDGGLGNIAAAESTTAITGTGWYAWNISNMVAAAEGGALFILLTSDQGANTQSADANVIFAGSLYDQDELRPVVLITTSSGTSGEAGTSPPGGTGRISIGGSGRMNPK